jgi:DNA replication ATP-dependent helicase Dna2
MTSNGDITAARFGVIADITVDGTAVVVEDDDGSTLHIPFTLDKGLLRDVIEASKTLIGRRVSTLEHGLPLSREPLLVLEPEITIDVTDASSLLSDFGLLTGTLALKRLRQIAPPTPAMLAGSVVNGALDALVRRPELNDTEVMSEAMQSRPLAIAALARDGQRYRELVGTVRNLLSPLRQIVTSWQGSDVVLEPFLISPALGLQGRADIVLRRSNELTVIELKVGRPRALDRPDHVSQVASYVALLGAAHETNDVIMGQMWYITDQKNPLRAVEDFDNPLRSIIDARNAIVLNDLRVQHGDMKMLKVAQLGPQHQTGISSYERDEWERLTRSLTGLGQTERFMIAEWLRMAANEQSAARLGGGSGRCAADLWRLTPEERKLSPTVLTDLTFDRDCSNVETMHLTFRRTPQPVPTAIRLGDAVVLRRMIPDQQTGASKSGLELYKGSVRSIDVDNVTVSLRNKYADVSRRGADGWIIEQDVTDSGMRTTLTSIRSLIDADVRRRNVLLGLAAPVHAAAVESTAPNLTDVQRGIVERAVAARELFLIQGPPGSGKTSAVLRAIIQELLRQPHHRILALAFTNRAANEICDVLKRHGVHYLRQGSVEGATGEGSIPRLARELTPEDLADSVSSTRVIVATVASIHSAPEIWSLGEFDTVIVDEASQIIESQLIGILARCQRTIMIGDHCQLPAVIAQPPGQLGITSDRLGDVCMTNLGMSGFERLIRCAHRRGDTESVAMLTQQGRMHEDVMRFPSEAFYGGYLTCLSDSQRSRTPLLWAEVVGERVCMIEVDAPQQLREEALVLSHLAEHILRSTHSHIQPPSIGIITPFRMQNNAVLQMLDESLPTELRSRVIVDTVERFQGSECDVILYGTAVTSEQEFDAIRSDVLIDGVLVDRKLNVAITRAREQFVLVGNPSVLRLSPIYKSLIDSIPHRTLRS